MTLFESVVLGLATATQPINLLFCLIGGVVGMLVGVLPGIGTIAAISMLLPLTFYLEPATAMIMLAGIYYGSSYGGSTAAILLNIPGSPSSAVVCLDGYPMAQQGRAGIALFVSTVGSFFGGALGIILMMLFSPMIVQASLQFGAPEYFALLMLGLVAASSISDGSVVKSLAMVLLGIALGTVGLDLSTGTNRFSFGILELSDGFGLVGVAMGLFGIAEVISSVKDKPEALITDRNVTMASMIPTRQDIRDAAPAVARGAGVGAFFGMLPGVAGSVSSFVAYAIEKRVSRHPERFGHGAIEGVASPETANNAADQTSFIPTLTLGVPSGPTMALMIGALMMHGIAPGPNLITKEPALFWGLVMSFWIGNLMLVILNIPLIGLWVRLLTIPYRFLFPAIVVFACIGAYSVSNSTLDVWLMLAFGVLGYLIRLSEMRPAPLLLGFVLGPLLEEYFRRSLTLSRGNFLIFFERPISGTVMAITIVLLCWAGYSALRRRRAFAK